jgi:outer membrane translocation and assembly module TamA
VAFLDAGNTFLEPSKLDVKAFEVGAGLGLRLTTPVGTLRFDFGVPASRGGGLQAGRLHFSFGQAF